MESTQVSIMSVFEYYRMGLPMFVPSPRLLTKWHLQYRYGVNAALTSIQNTAFLSWLTADVEAHHLRLIACA